MWRIFLGVWLVGIAWAEAPCRNIRVNYLGSTGVGTDIVVSTVPVRVLEAHTARCGVRINNLSATNDVRCAPASGPYAFVPTEVMGAVVSKGSSSQPGIFGGEMQQAWSCVRVGSGDGLLNVLEAVP